MKCPNCRQDFEGSCSRYYGCVYATTSVSQIDKENGIQTTVDGQIISYDKRALEDWPVFS